jgi:hypothetical protein
MLQASSCTGSPTDNYGSCNMDQGDLNILIYKKKYCTAGPTGLTAPCPAYIHTWSNGTALNALKMDS